MGKVNQKNFIYSHYKILVSLLLLLLLVASVVYLSIAGLRVNRNAMGTLRFNNGIMAEVTNLDVTTKSLTAPELSLYASAYNNTEYEENEYLKVNSLNFTSIQPGDKIQIVNPTIQPAVGSANYCLRAKLVVRVGNTTYSEDQLREVNLAYLPRFNSLYWAKGAEGYYYNTVYSNGRTLDVFSDLNINTYGGSAIPFFSSEDDERCIEVVDVFNYNYDLNGKIEIQLVVEAVQSMQEYVEEEWDSIVNPKNMALDDMLIVPEGMFSSLSDTVVESYGDAIPSFIISQMDIENETLMIVFMMQNIPFNEDGVFDVPYANLKNPTEQNIEEYQQMESSGSLPEGFENYLYYAQSYLDNSDGYTLLGYIGDLTDVELKHSYRCTDLDYLNYQARVFVYLATGVLYPYDLFEDVGTFTYLNFDINTLRILNKNVE